jgi:hypothetical protein
MQYSIQAIGETASDGLAMDAHLVSFGTYLFELGDEYTPGKGFKGN